MAIEERNSDIRHDGARRPLERGSFSDTRVCLVRAGDREAPCATFWDESTVLASEQDDDGPTYLIIGGAADDAALRRAANRHGIGLEHLIAFRDSNCSALATAASAEGDHGQQ
jgi:hypothetical protein